MPTNLARERSGKVIVLVNTRLKCSHPDPGSYHLPQSFARGCDAHIWEDGTYGEGESSIPRCQIAIVVELGSLASFPSGIGVDGTRLNRASSIQARETFWPDRTSHTELRRGRGKQESLCPMR